MPLIYVVLLQFTLQIVYLLSFKHEVGYYTLLLHFSIRFEMLGNNKIKKSLPTCLVYRQNVSVILGIWENS